MEITYAMRNDMNGSTTRPHKSLKSSEMTEKNIIMLPISFKKNITYAVLVSYFTQFCAPVVYAAEASAESKANWQALHIPRIEALGEAQKIIEDYEQGKKDAILSQSEAYQYLLGIKVVDAKKDQFQIKFSRKEKGATGAFETLHKESINKKKVDSAQPGKELPKDALLTLFKGATVHKLDESSTTVLIPGFGKLILAGNGTVIFDKDHTTSLLSCYDLILKASGKLHIQSLVVAALTLDAKKSKILGIVTTKDLCINHDVVNLMGLCAHTITGTGTLINQGRLELEGTVEAPAILGIHKITNEKNKKHDIDAKIESAHLHITSSNKDFMNGEDAIVKVTEKLHVGQLDSATLLNKGHITLRDGEIHRAFTNESEGELTVLNQLISMKHFINKGDVEVKKLFKLTTCQNMGTIQGKILDIVKEMTNEGNVSLHELSGKGTFNNHRGLEFLRQDGIISIYGFVNKTQLKNKPATLKGSLITLSENNRTFWNYTNSDILCEDLCSGRSTMDLIGDTCYRPLRNFGTIKTTSLTTDQWGFENWGTLETTSLTIQKGNFRNHCPSCMKILGTLTIEEGTFQNEYKIFVKDLLGSGKFTNTRNKGKIQFIGTQQNPSLIQIKEFEGDFNQTSGYHKDSMCSLYESNLVWKNVNWTGASKEYMLPLGTTSWTFDNVTCSKPLNIHNHGAIHLIDSTLTFSHLINHGKVKISGGKYSIQNLSTTKHSNAGLISFQDKACDFVVNALNHQGVIHVDPEIKQKITVGSGTMTGKTIGKNLVLDVQKSLINAGYAALWNLDGYGKFINKGKLQFTGTQENPSTLRIAKFENGSDEADAQPAKITGSHIEVNGLNKAFITHDNSEILAKKLFFTKIGDLLSKSTLEIKGIIHTNELDINRHITTFLGTVETLIFSINGEKFTNQKNALLHVGTSIKANVKKINNNGKMIVDQGTFTQKTGRFSNHGHWEQHGDIDLDLANLENYGTLIWKNGKLSLGTVHTNYGNWTLDGMTSTKQLSIDSCGCLHLKSGTLNFSRLVNSQDLILSEGKYTTFRLENEGLLTFLHHDWILKNSKPDSNDQNYLVFTASLDLGEIESEKALTISSHVTPKKVSSKGVVTTHHKDKTFDGLLQIQTPEVTSHCLGFTTLRDYKFNTINVLNLIISGPFSLNHTLTAGSIVLDVKGKFTLGTSNTNMGTLAATNGRLLLGAVGIDARFGKIYGFGRTGIRGGNGDIVIGAPKSGGPFLQTKNGSYIASGGSLLISGSNLNIHYGQIATVGELSLNIDKEINHIAGDILSQGDIRVRTPSFSHTRDGTYTVPVGNWTWAYSGCYNYCEKSDQAFMRALGNIYLDTSKGYCLASTIVAQKSIFYRPYVGTDDRGIFKESRPSSFVVSSRSNYGYGCNDKVGYQQGCSPCSTYNSTVQAGEKIEITTGSFVISGMINSPLITIKALQAFGSGSGTFLNPNRTRTTLNPTGPIVVDLTESIQYLAQSGGFFNQLASGEVVSEFPFGTPSQPKLNQILYLIDGKEPHIQAQQVGIISHHQNGLNFANNFHIFNPLRSLNLDSWIQLALSANAGKVHFKDESGVRYQGNDLYNAVMGNSGKWIRNHNKNTMDQEDLKTMTGVMLLLKLQEVAGGIQETLKLVIGPDEVNPYQSDGDISGEKFLCHTDGQQNHFNNRIVMENDLVVTSKKGIKRETQTYETVCQQGDTTIHRVNAMPQQQFISLKGSVKVVADEDIVDIGTATEAGEDVIKESATGNIIERTLILPTTVTTMTEEDNGPFGGAETTTTSQTTHDFLQTTIKAGRKGHFKAKKDIDLEGSQHIADELGYWGLNYKNSSILVANTSSTTTEESGMFSDKTTSLYQETPAAAFAVAMAKHIYNMCETITANGVTFQAEIYVDGSKDGGKYGPLVKEMKHHQQITVDTPLSSLDAGQEGGQEVEIKTAFNVQKIIHQPKGLVVLNDNTYRKVELIPGDDNACGFIALQSHLGVAPEKARETAVKKILAGLDNSDAQQIICNLIAPEILDGAFGGDSQLGYLPGAQIILDDANLAEANQTKAMVMFREIFGQEETKDQTAEQLVESIKPEEDAPLGSHRAYRELHRAVQKISEIEAQKKAWATNPRTVKQFLLSVVAQPNWMLTNVPAYLKTPTGVMDALAYVLGMNVKVLTEVEGKLEVIHAHAANSTWPTVELLHCEYIPNSGYKNHFNLLQKAESPTGMIFTNVDIDKQVTEIIGAYKEEFYAIKKRDREWCEKSQAVPDLVIAVIAIAAVVVTKGMGASIVNGMMGTTTVTGATAGAATVGVGTATAAGTAATLSATQIAMANVAFSSLAAKVTTSLLKTGDLIACVKEVLSKESLLNLAITIASAGIAEKVGAFCDVNMGVGEKAFTEHFQEHAIRNTSALAVGTLAGQHLNGDMMLNTAANTVFDAVSARIANNRGQTQREKPVHPVLHGIGHAVDAFSIGYISSKVTGVKDPIKVARDRAVGAFAAETFGGYLIEPGETNAKILENAADISRVVTAALGAALGFDVNDVDKGAMNALSNNFMTSAEEEEEDEKKRKKKSLIQCIYGDEDGDHFTSPKASEMFNGQKIAEEDIQECRALNVPYKPNRQQDWITMETPLEKARTAIENSMNRFVDIQNKEFTQLQVHEYFGILPLYTLKGISYLDSCIGSPLSQFGQKFHDRAQDVGNIFRDGTFYVTGNHGISQDVGYAVELGLKTAVALIPIKFFRGSKAPVINQYTFQNDLTVQILKDIQKVQYKSLSNQNRVPFIKKLNNWGYIPEDISFGKLVILGEQSGTYLGHTRTSFGYDGYLQNLRAGSKEWNHHHKSPYVVGIHGTENGVELTKYVVDKPNKYLTLELLSKNPISYSLESATTGHRLLAKIIKKDPVFNKDRFVTLLSCDTGKAEFAQNLANSLGATVLAPTELIWATPDGILMIGQAKKGMMSLSLDLNQLGQFKLFSPGNHQLTPSSLKTSAAPIILEGEFYPLDALSKKLKSMNNNPKGDWHISDLQYIAERYGITYRQNSTSHVTFTYPHVKSVIAPARKSMKPVYIKQFLDMLDSVIAQQAK